MRKVLHRGRIGGTLFLVTNNYVKSHEVVGYACNGEILCAECAAMAAFAYAENVDGCRVSEFRTDDVRLFVSFEDAVADYLEYVETCLGWRDEDGYYRTSETSADFPTAVFADQMNGDEHCGQCHTGLLY